MHVFSFRSYLQKFYFIPFAYFFASFPYRPIYTITYNHSSVLRWARYVIQQHRYVMGLVYIFTHND